MKDIMKMIQEQECEVERNYSNCKQCIYRDIDIGHCYYTVATNHTNKIENNICQHYTNRDTIINEIHLKKKQ